MHIAPWTRAHPEGHEGKSRPDISSRIFRECNIKEVAFSSNSSKIKFAKENLPFSWIVVPFWFFCFIVFSIGSILDYGICVGVWECHPRAYRFWVKPMRDRIYLPFFSASPLSRRCHIFAASSSPSPVRVFHPVVFPFVSRRTRNARERGRGFVELSLPLRRLSLVPMDAHASNNGDHRPSRRCDTPGVHTTLDPRISVPCQILSVTRISTARKKKRHARSGGVVEKKYCIFI